MQNETSVKDNPIINNNIDPEYLKRFSEVFCPTRSAPFKIELDPIGWREVNQYNITLPMIRKHLLKIYHLGNQSPWYSTAGIMDFDNPDPEDIERIKERFGFDENNSMFITSPSHKKNHSSCHLLWKPVYDTDPSTARLFRTIVEPICSDIPHLDKKFPWTGKVYMRMPFGKDQNFIDHYGTGEILHPDWMTMLEMFEKLDSIDISSFNDYQLKFKLKYDTIRNDKNMSEAMELFDNGLQQSGTTNESLFEIMKIYRRQNVTEWQAVRKTKDWIYQNHNGKCSLINSGNTRTLDKEIERIGKSLYKYYDENKCYPDNIHNQCQGLTMNDLILAGNYFAGSMVDIKRFLKFMLIYSVHAHRGWVVITRDQFIKHIADHRSYIQFKNKLKEHGLLENSHYSYKHGTAKQYLFKGYKQSRDFLKYDGRHIDNVNDILAMQDKDFLKNHLKLNRMTINRLCNKTYTPYN